MKKYKEYPITVSDVTDRYDKLDEIFLREKPHDGAYIGVSKLDGSFLCENSGEIFSSLEIGERLSITPDENFKNLLNPPLCVNRADGTFLGVLPFSASILPNALLSRGVEVFCFAEAKRFNGGLPEIAVSIYCEKY